MPQRSSPFDYRGAGIRHADYLAALVDGSPGEPLLRAAGKLARFAREHTAAWEAHRAARIALGKGAPDNTALRRGERTARWALARARVALQAARAEFQRRAMIAGAPAHRATIASTTLALREGRGKPRPADWHGVRIAPEHTRARFVRADRRATSRAARYFAHAQACETRDRRDSVPRAIGAGDAQHVRARLGGTMVRPAPVVSPPTAGPSHVYRAPPRRGTQCTRKGAVVAAVVERRR